MSKGSVFGFFSGLIHSQFEILFLQGDFFLKKILTDPHGASSKETACQGGRR